MAAPPHRTALLLALLASATLAATLALPAAGAQSDTECPAYQTETLTLTGGDHYVRTQEYECTTTSGGTTTHRHVLILRVAEAAGDPTREDDDRIHLHIEYQTVRSRESDGTETHETSIIVKDSGQRIKYQELEHAEETSPEGTCTSRTTHYRGSATTEGSSVAWPLWVCRS